jgi:hypothetical protein
VWCYDRSVPFVCFCVCWGVCVGALPWHDCIPPCTCNSQTYLLLSFSPFSCSDLVQHGVVMVVAGADHHGIRPLLLAHGLPLPPSALYWPLELAQPAAGGKRAFWLMCVM